MGITNLYYRIVRPKAFIPDYIGDSRYALDQAQLSRAYKNIENELKNIFNYIEPDEANKHVFSFELYSLLLRACTEVELNCKLIMEANGATPSTMTEYKKLEKSSLLSKYKVIYRNWRMYDENSREIIYLDKEFYPFKNFAPSISKSPKWYVAYNEVKHNREKELYKANLENCMNAVAAILVLLYSQFGANCIDFSYNANTVIFRSIDAYDDRFTANSIFDIQPPQINDWSAEELYDFNWDDIKNDAEPFKKYRF